MNTSPMHSFGVVGSLVHSFDVYNVLVAGSSRVKALRRPCYLVHGFFGATDERVKPSVIVHERSGYHG
jgi:hypothetical protein